MSRIQTFVSNDTKKKLDAIIRQRNIDCSYALDINLSNTTAMLIELGIKTYHQEIGREGDKFDHEKYNKTLLEHVMKASLIAQYLAKSQSRSDLGINGDESRPISAIIDSRVKEAVEELFPLTECELVDKTLRELS